MNYCPICKREYKEMSGNQTLHCPVCGTTLIELSGNEIAHVRSMNRQKNE
ncbi:MAG: hypothetical protein ABFC78_09585 [Methanoregula sp.]